MSDEMLTTTLDVSGLERAQELLRKFPLRLIEALRRANVKSSAVALQRLKSVKLVGGNPLGAYLHSKRTGNLSRSWAVKVPERVPGGWDGGMGSNSEYAAAHEFGVDKTKAVTVKSYTRAEHRRDTFRKSAANYRRGGTGVVRSSEGVAFVHSFTRNQHTKLPARPYARPSVTETRDRMDAIHKDEIRIAWEESK